MQLMPAEGNHYLDCVSLTDSGISTKICKMEVVTAGKMGWVSDQWFMELE